MGIVKTADEYYITKAAFFDKYEKSVREWLRQNKSNEDIVTMIPFFEDGIVCPEVWFSKDNNFRPLFVLKETSIGIDDSMKLKEYYNFWGKQTRFDNVCDEFGDIRIGVNRFNSNNPWQRIVKLAYGMKNALEKDIRINYTDIVDMSFKKGKRNPNNVEGNPLYDYSTANTNYISTVNQISIINIKKVAGGTKTNSELSKTSKAYNKHLDGVLGDLFIQQIEELINPNIIVFCSPDISSIIKQKYGDRMLSKYICIDGYHPTMTRTELFYDNTIAQLSNRKTVLHK